MTRVRLSSLLAAFWFALAGVGGISVAAEPPVRVVVSFSILEDIVREVGGSDIAVTSLVGRDANEHVFEPSPEKVRLLTQAQLFIVNGLGLEGWLTRLIQSAQYRGPVVVATEGIVPITTIAAGEKTPTLDPHAWQDVENGVVCAENIAHALADADPARADIYRRRFGYYKTKLDRLDREVREKLGTITAEKRRVITTHDAFAYYGRAYGVTFTSPEGLSTDSEPSAKTIAALIRQIRREGIKALFLENISDRRLMEEIARETGATLGPPLYSDALSAPDGPAPTYIRMIEYNTAALTDGMLKNLRGR
jgi:zinc/manganese transport system substrate-binding protein